MDINSTINININKNNIVTILKLYSIPFIII